MPGWGSELWGADEWGSFHEPTPVHIPTSEEFPSADVSYTQLGIFLDYIEVSATLGPPWIAFDDPTNRLIFNSADVFTAAEIVVPTTNNWTLEADLQPITLPATFADLNSSRVFIGAFNSQGYGGGIAISRQGIAIINSLVGEAYAIPGSMNLIEEGTDFYTVRLVVRDNGTMSVFITLTSLLPVTGHVLRYTTTAFESPTGAQDGVLIDLQGSATQTVSVGFHAIRFNGHSFLIPNKRPVAIPGPDKNVALNTPAKYDGSASYDPEGQPLSYLWTLTSTPGDSVFKISGSGGSTPDAHTFLGGASDSFSTDNASLLQPGDTLILGDSQFTVAVGSPAEWEKTPISNGRYVRVDGVWADDRISVVEDLPIGLSGESWTLYHSATYYSDQTSATTSAVPDKAGLYRTQLVVNDGQLDSLPAWSLTEVTTTVVTFGVIPDVSFIWLHLTDFMGLLDDKDTVERVWSSFAQGAAEVLMAAWQIDYNKSLKDIQKVFQKRWLSYELLTCVDSTAALSNADTPPYRTLTSSIFNFRDNGVRSQDFAKFNVTEIASGQVHTVVCEISSYPFGASFGSFWFIDSPLSDLYAGHPEEYTTVFAGCLRCQALPIDELIVDVPRLQEVIKDAPSYLTQNQDYSIHPPDDVIPYTSLRLPSVYTVVDYPPDVLWAEITYVNNNPAIEANFGSLVGLSAADFKSKTDNEGRVNTNYLAAVRGLWYAYFQGPATHVVQIGTQILLGLPFAEEDGVVLSIDTHFSAQSGRMFLQDVQDSATIRSYIFPLVPNSAGEVLAVNQRTGTLIAVGDTVGQFEPLCNGIEVADYVNDSQWPKIYGGVFKEVEKLFRFIVRADVDAFGQTNTTYAISFVKQIKPHYTKLLFVLLKRLQDGPIKVTDQRSDYPNHPPSIAITRLEVTTASPNNIGGYRWDDNVDGTPFPSPNTGQSDGQTLQAYDQDQEFLFDQPQLFPGDRVNVLVSSVLAEDTVYFDSIWAFDDGGGLDIIPLSGPDSSSPSPYGPLVGVVHFDVVLPGGTYHRQWWL